MMIKFTMFILIFTISCASKKTATVAILAAKPNACPSDGKCTIQLFENKSLEINTVNSKIRYTLLDNDQKTVVKYEFSRNLEKSVVDGGYREEIIFPIGSKLSIEA